MNVFQINLIAVGIVQEISGVLNIRPKRILLFHLYMKETETHVLTIRGTKQVRDMVEDLVLWGQILSLQAVGMVSVI
eukprot:UN10709